MSFAGFDHAPITLAPSPVDATLYDKARVLCADFNVLVDRISRDESWLLEALRTAADADSFTGRLHALLTKLRAQGALRQRVRMGIFRTEYMQHGEGRSAELKQVELNTISSSFGMLSQRASELHEFLIKRMQLPGYETARLPKNHTIDEIPLGLATAHRVYIDQVNRGDARSAVVLMVVQEGERNVLDQRILELKLWEAHGVRLVRKSLGAIAAEGALDKDGRLTLSDDLEASVVYFRAGYTPDDYQNEACWAARELIERSMAIKCPDITYHLVGTKKVQQILSVPGVLERFVDSEQALSRLQQCFCRLYSLDSTDADIGATIDRALRDAGSYVLKPQREGGGNNLYDDDLVAALKSFPPHELEGFILMDMIKAPTVQACIMRNGTAVTADAIFELGIYGVVISDGLRVLHNRFAGHLLRTKEAASKEAGVAAGFGSIDSPYLI